ncbi:glycosyltransferase family 4 protein [Chryseolinea sp. H1M3-3]|uniref:glycosyltransferase family 4 protein n=1 Tax=Chryseolinea sp. H1M3-3 TaxID=3034144 RepID=UPI0023ED67EE|nr:glycosyltransferase family 4 protein [Chryseolinea sp. H1M3-3]
MKIIVTHPTGNRNVRAVLSSFDKAGLLAEFNTTVHVDAASSWLKALPSGVRSELLRRTYPIPASRVTTRPILEGLRLALPKFGLSKFTQSEKSFASIDAVYRDLDKNVSKRLSSLLRRQPFDAVYGYEDGAFETFKRAKNLGLKCIYDLPIAYWETSRKLLLEEATRKPSWAITLGGGITDSEEKLNRKTRELELADVVVGPGSFVMNSLPSWAKNKKIVVSPFGSPEGQASSQRERKPSAERPLRVLFVGSMGQRKGLGDLFDAFKMLNNKNIELVVLGSLLAPMDFYKKEFSNFQYEANRPNEQVLELMRSCDVFCLPSIVEGRALVMQEAMSQGLPIIITENTGGSDLVEEGKTGFLVPIRSPQAIAEKISWFLDNRSAIPQMGINAKQHAATYTWENYGSVIVNSLTQFNKE